MALEQALADFPAGAERCAIILVTDGKEVCGGDLKASAEKLRQPGGDLDLRIIGFGLDAEAEAVASFQGIGTFESAKDAEALAAALDRAAENA